MNQPLVLLHGWGMNALVWDRIMPLLEAHFEVTAIDLPGYGDDIDYFDEYSLDAVVNEVLSRAPEKANWVGWSLGATIAMAAAILRPERFMKLQLVSATPCFLTRPDWSHGIELAPFESLARTFDEDYQKAIKSFLLLQVLTNDRIQFKESRVLVRELTADLIRSPRPRNQTLQEGLKILSQTDLRPQLSRLSVETQLIAGNRDHVVPTAASEFLFRHLPNGHSFQVFRAGHLPFLQVPSKYIEALTQFMNLTQ
jgi:pimeloyl-[acyl-carrier protein] methyl ester esterase